MSKSTQELLMCEFNLVQGNLGFRVFVCWFLFGVALFCSCCF